MAEPNNLLIKTDKLNRKINDFINSGTDEIIMNEFIEMIKEYDEISFLLDCNNKTEILPNISGLKLKYTNFIKEKIKTLIKEKDYKKAISLIIDIIQIDISCVSAADKFIRFFTENELYSEAIELYKIIFLYTSNPDYFEKIGDIQVLKGNVEDAIESYLNYVEMGNAGINVYKKLVKLFNKLNDKISENACLEQIKIFEEENAK